MKRLCILFFFVLLLSCASIDSALMFYPTREVDISGVLQGEQFYLCNGQLFHFPFADISLRYVPGDRGGPGGHVITIRERDIELIYCADGRICGEIEKGNWSKPEYVHEGLELHVESFDENLVYQFTIKDEYPGYVVLELTRVYAVSVQNKAGD